MLDYLAQAAQRAPGRITRDYGWEFLRLEVGDDAVEEYPVTVQLQRTDGAAAGRERTIRAKYVIVKTDFPDGRRKATIHSEKGSILHIPREGGHLCRIYVDLGEVPVDDNHAVRNTPVDEVIRRANEIYAPYSINVQNVAWSSVYEVGHRVTDKFDEVDDGDEGATNPHVFTSRAGASLLHSYSDERQEIAQNLIDFDREWSSMMARRPEEFDYPGQLEEFYEKTFEFPAGFMTQYQPLSRLCGSDEHQALANGVPLGKRFKSGMVVRRGDNTPLHLGHSHAADGRWRIYVFADAAKPADDSATKRLGDWLGMSPESPIVKYTPADLDQNAYFDSKVIYQQDYPEVEDADVPAVFFPEIGQWRVNDWEKVFATGRGHDIFEERGISRDGAIVVVRPDQYVAQVLPLDATAELAAFFDGFMTQPK